MFQKIGHIFPIGNMINIIHSQLLQVRIFLKFQKLKVLNLKKYISYDLEPLYVLRRC